MEKLLPQNIEAERGVLGSIIIDPEAVERVDGFLRADAFYRDAHRVIYSAIADLTHAHTPADFITLCDELERRGTLDSVGGASYISSLVNEVPTSGNVEYYGRIVERTAILRSLIHASGEIAAIAYDEVDATLAVEKAEQLICGISQAVDASHGTSRGLVSMTDAMSRFLAQLDQTHTKLGQPIGLETGFVDLDDKLGGLHPQELYLLGGKPSEGKTALFLNIIYNLWQKQTRIAMFSLEMSLFALMSRLVSMHTGIDSQDIRKRTLYDDDWAKIIKTAGDFDCTHIHFDETPRLTIGQIASRARRHQMQHGLDIIFVDYLQLARADGNYKRGDKRQEIDEIVEGLKAMAKELDVPVFVIASLNRNSNDEAPDLSAFKESSSIEYTADVAMFIRRSKERPGYNIVDVRKHRNGPIGDITLRFDATRQQFYDVPRSEIASGVQWPPEEGRE